jgi:hypothetical protein
VAFDRRGDDGCPCTSTDRVPARRDGHAAGVAAAPSGGAAGEGVAVAGEAEGTKPKAVAQDNFDLRCGEHDPIHRSQVGRLDRLIDAGGAEDDKKHAAEALHGAQTATGVRRPTVDSSPIWPL